MTAGGEGQSLPHVETVTEMVTKNSRARVDPNPCHIRTPTCGQERNLAGRAVRGETQTQCQINKQYGVRKRNPSRICAQTRDDQPCTVRIYKDGETDGEKGERRGETRRSPRSIPAIRTSRRPHGLRVPPPHQTQRRNRKKPSERDNVNGRARRRGRKGCKVALGDAGTTFETRRLYNRACGDTGDTCACACRAC